MKQRRILVSAILVLTLLFSVLTLGSCDLIGKIFGPDDSGSVNPGPDHTHNFVEGKCECGETDPNYTPGPDDNPGGDNPGGDNPGGDNPGGDNPGDDTPKDEPTLSELDSKFYDAKNWVYMTNNNGASLDGGDIPYTMADGSIKFHRANQAIEMGDFTNSTISFMLKATNDFSIWMNSSTIDNAGNSSYRLNYAYGGLRIALSSAPEKAAAIISDENYNKGEWNRFDIVFSTENGVCNIKVYINGTRAALHAGDNTTNVSVADNTLTHTQPFGFATGKYMVVKVWEAHNYIQLKPVAKADEKDLPIIACIGASITEGAGAGNFYLESYPAQLQNALGGLYNVVNFGNSGKTVREDLGDDVAWLRQNQWTGVQAIVPDIAILNIGTNDSKTSNNPVSTYDSFYAAYKHLISELLKVNPEMQIVICTVPYAYSGIWDINNDNIANIIAPVQRAIAKEDGHTLIDLYEYSQGKSHLFPDGVHPNTEGYAMFVEIIKKALLEGEEALTEEFINGINSKYTAKLSNIQASIEIDGDKINLIVTGDTSIAPGGYLKLGVTPGETGGAYVDAVIADGKFTATIDLATVPRASEWFNVRLYTSETVNELVLMTQTPGYTQGMEFAAGKNKVTLKSWTSGNNPTLSLVISDNVYVQFESVVIKPVNGVPTLIVKGQTNDSNPRLYIGDDPNKDNYKEYVNITTDADGKFEAHCVLSRMPVGSACYNARIYLSDNSYYTISSTGLTDGENPINVGDTIYCTNTKFSIQSWNDGGIASLSFSVSHYDSSYTLTPTEVKFENGKLVLKGTSTNVNSLVAYLYDTNEGIDSYNANATIAADGSFVAEIDLAQLTASAGNWYFLMVSVNGGERIKVTYQNYDSNEQYASGFRVYKWEYWEGIAVNYTDYSYGITNATITEVDGKAMLTIEGVLNNSGIAANTITLLLDKTKGTKEQLFLENLATEAGKFKFVYDISAIINSEVATQYNEEAYFIRLYVNGSKYSDVNSLWLRDSLFESVEIGNGKYYFMRNNASAYYTLGLVRLDNVKPIPVVTPTEVKMLGDKLIFSGKAENVDSLVVYLYDTNEGIDSYNVTANIAEDGSFTVELGLDQLTASAGNWYFVMISVNGEEKAKVAGAGVTFGDLTASGFRNYNWASKDNIAISYSNIDYTITNYSITEVDGKAVLTIEGAMKDSTTAADTIKLRLDKTSDTKQQIDIDNLATEAGKFKFVYDISEIYNSTVTTQYGEQAYFIRLFVNGAKKADINSRWAATDLFETVEIGDGVYYFMRNNATSWNTLGLVRLPASES